MVVRLQSLEAENERLRSQGMTDQQIESLIIENKQMKVKLQEA